MLLCFLLLASSSSQAWSGYTHQMIARESLGSVSQKWHLDETVTITPFSYFLTKLSKEKPEIQTREDFAKWIQINPVSKLPFDAPRRDEKIGATTTPLKILSMYASRPDDGRDKNLPYDTLEQFWFGAGTKTVSQAFRHMEKPPFNLLHPLNTFGFPLGRLGQATERAQIYFDLALLAHRLGEPYWAWNFLGCSLHYIEDLQQPYHSAQLSPPLAWEGVKAYFDWGRRAKKGLIPTVTHIASNAHHYFEGTVDYLLTQPTKTKELWRNSLRGKKVLSHEGNIQNLAKTIRDFSSRLAFDAMQATLNLSNKTLMGPTLYHIDDEENKLHLEDPTHYLNPDAEKRMQSAAQISKIVLSSFEEQGKAVRTVVWNFLNEVKKTNGR